MIEFGETLRKAREARGLSAKDIADRTHMMIQMVEELENENFSRIAAPIYGRGFVKLYCETVGIDPKPLVAEFMDIFNGNRPPTIRVREQPSTPPAHVTAAQLPAADRPTAAEPPAVTEQPRTDSGPAPSAPGPAFEREPVPEPSLETGLFGDTFRLEQETAKPLASSPAAAHPSASPVPRTPSRYAAPSPIEDCDRPSLMPSLPPAFWRILVLAAAATAILWALLAGARALYRATMTPSDGESAVRHGTTEAASGVEAAPAGRRPMDIPPLYID